MKSTKQIWQKWSIAFKVFPLMVVVALLKLLSHKFGMEVMELNALFTSLVAGTIFLIGFLISGVLSDYKESEKIPSELTASMKALLDYSGKGERGTEISLKPLHDLKIVFDEFNIKL